MKIVFTLLLAVLSVAFAQQHGIVVQLNDGHFVGLFVEGVSAFRVSVAYDKSQPLLPITSDMVAPHNNYASWTQTTSGNWKGIKTSFGEVRIESQTGAFMMLDSNGNIVTQTSVLSKFHASISDRKVQHNDTCVDVYDSTDCSSGTRTPSCPDGLSGTTQATCCAACNNDPDCSFWVYAKTPDQGKNCWLLFNVPKRVSRANRVTGGSTLPGPTSVTLYLGRQNNAAFYGSGGSAGSSFTQTSITPRVQNTAFWTPRYWSTEGYGALGVSSLLYTPGDVSAYPATWHHASSSLSNTDVNVNENTVQWDIMGSRVDLYLMPSTNPAAGLRTYWELTGAPAIPPRYAFGFLACRWGWENRQYIADILSKFRSGSYPLDAWISDFEWYTSKPDYSLPLSGDPAYQDFTYCNATFPDPIVQLKEYHNNYHVKFGGIRKPRLGNSNLLVMARSKGWCLPSSRDLNYSIPELRKYYLENNQHFYADGVDFWWNDEGETQYYTFQWWTQTEADGLALYDAHRRPFTINRAYTPGMQRLAASVWTGDIPVTWEALRQSANYLLTWMMSGAGYVTCDIGGFNGGNTPGQLLVRWYQLGVFMGLMRVHSTLGNTPHFPFMYADEFANPMRLALNLRYKLSPMFYSLAHHQYYSGTPILRPLLFDYLQDSTASSKNDQWMMGGLLVAPVLQEDNSRDVYLPADNRNWFEFGSSVTHNGPTVLHLSNVPLSSLPMYVRAGSILLLAPVVQYMDQLPGGALEVQVYAGADAQFVMVEDEGMNKDYQSLNGGVDLQMPKINDAAIRSTTFTWTQATRTLSWVVSGSFSDEHVFTQVWAHGFFEDGSQKSSLVVALGQMGSLIL
eukprot:TRINITY_DN11811_c0_g1_i1.p1 TRINITY_DN11811_c0_g1~~TRINITY_DN11811_c0_g1_i1.p1  ORF type:complete len:849 (-),score=254.76 TRINITY_DN11811_c0_g1_i1:229-2775(-)